MTLADADVITSIPPSDDWRDRTQAFRTEIGRAVLGQERVIELILIAVLARGHVLLEGDVGVGKTTLLRAAARAIGGAYERIEGTIDLIPGDLVYHSYLGDDGRPRVEPGPVLRRGEDLAVLFFNEINRARPQVHSLLLRLMAERSLSAFNRVYRFPHLQVFADRNQVEREETFELPVAARDRFLMEITVTVPEETEARRRLIFDPIFHDTDALVATVAEAVFDYRSLDAVAVAIQRGVRTSPALETYVLALWQALSDPAQAGVHVDGVDVARLIAGSISPRGLSFLVRAARCRAWLAGRSAVMPEDVRAVFTPVMAHRLVLAPIYENRRVEATPALCRAVLATVPVP